MRTALFSQIKSKSYRPESANSNVMKKMFEDIRARKTCSSQIRNRKLNVSEDGYDSVRESRFEKERMQQEMTYLKQQIHSIGEENLRLKTRIHQLEDYCVRNEKLIEEYDKIGGNTKPEFAKFTAEAHLVNALKKQINQLRDEIKQKDTELNKVKRTLKFTKINEVLIEKQAFEKESKRLAVLLESTVQISVYSMQQANIEKEIQDKIMNFVQQIQSLKSDQIESEKVIERLKKQCVQYKSHQLDAELKSSKEIKKMKDLIEEKNKEVESMRPSRTQKQMEEDYHTATKQLRDLIKKVEEYQKIMMEQKFEIDELRHRLDQAKENSQDSQTDQLSSRQLDLSRTPKILNNQLDYLKIPDREDSATPISREFAMKNSMTVPDKPKQKRRNKPINYNDIKIITDTLKYRLMALGIDCDELDEYIFTDQMLRDGYCTFLQLRQQLQNFPFDLPQSQALMVAKYVIENDDQELNDDTLQFNPFVKSVIRRIVGNYKLSQVKMALEKSEKLKDALTRFKPFIISQIKQMYNPKATRVSKEQFIDVLTALQLELTSVEVDYMIVQGIMESENIQSLNYMEMLNYVVEQKEQEQAPFMITQNEYIKIQDSPIEDFVFRDLGERDGGDDYETP
ncbi:hypothetical protein pb186bvf_009882 [Paramecium bursaria]